MKIRNLQYGIVLLGVVLLTMTTTAQTFGDFTEVTPSDSIFITPPEEDFWITSTAPADYDNDGDLDIAVLGYYVVYFTSVADKLILMRNDGASGPDQWGFTYLEVPLGTLSTGSSDLAWGDVDGDGDLDLAVGTDNQTVIFRNDSGTLLPSGTDLPGYMEDNDQGYFELHSISFADYDNDGDLDLLLPSVFDINTYSFRTALMRNDGSNGTNGWIFTETDTVFSSTSHAQSQWADDDGDGDLDLLLVNIAPQYGQSFIKRYRNDGNGIFVDNEILGSLSIEHGEAQWGDYDFDGDLDILVAGNLLELNGSLTPMALRIYRNDNETYVPFEVISDPAAEGWFDFTATTWGDYDSDGDMDILLAGHYNSGTQIEGRARIYTNTGGVFTDSGNELPAPHASGDHGGAFSWLDIDGEGDLDYFVAGEYFVPGGNGLLEAQMHLYRNDTPGQNDAPSTPTGLSVTQVSDSTVVLTWLPGLDDHTPSAALTYDMDVFRDNLPVSVPMRTPEPGDVSAATEWLLTGLQPGNYKWTLSAIDAAYSGSPVAVGEFSTFPVSAGPMENLPKGYSLGQNYPNPASQVTTINYSISEDAMVKLSVYNNQGVEMSRLVNEHKQAGKYEVSLDASKISAGIYYYRFQAGKYSGTKKMIIINGDASE